MPFPVSLSAEQYSALVALARDGTQNPDGTIQIDRARRLDAFLRDIEKAASIERHGLWVQWQEMDQPVPSTARFPEVWPPSWRFWLELTSRRIARADVNAVLTTKARKPTNVLVTPDPGAKVGWTEVAAYFING